MVCSLSKACHSSPKLNSMWKICTKRIQKLQRFHWNDYYYAVINAGVNRHLVRSHHTKLLKLIWVNGFKRKLVNNRKYSVKLAGFVHKNSVSSSSNDPSKACGGMGHRRGMWEASYVLNSKSDSEGEGAHISTIPAYVWDCHLLLYDTDMAVNHLFGFRSWFGKIGFLLQLMGRCKWASLMSSMGRACICSCWR